MKFWWVDARALLFASTAWGMAALAGCGSGDRAGVSGTMLHKDGTPLIGARVIATSEKTGKTSNGQTDGNGHFVLGTAETGDGIASGDYYVIIVEDRGDELNPRPQTISSKYAKPSASGLKLSVKTGEKTVLDAKLDPP